MGRLATLGMTAVAMATVWVMASSNTGKARTGSIVAEETGLQSAYRVVSRTVAANCVADKGRSVETGTFQLDMSGNCAAISPALGEARFWRDKADGSVEFLGAGGETLAAFAAGDGVDYESFFPADPMMALQSAE